MFNLLVMAAWRNFIRDKLTSIIQLSGLVIGVACFILIQLYVDHQNSFNQQFSNAENIYRVNLQRDDNRAQAATTLALAGVLKSNFSPVTDTTRLWRSNISVKHQQDVYAERALYADSNFFDFFDFELIEGDSNTALNAPDSLVINEDIAIKYFARSRNVIGNQITVNGKVHQITAVIKKTNTPNTIPATLLVPMDNFYKLLPAPDFAERWNYAASITFAKIDNQDSIAELSKSLALFYDERTRGISSYKKRRITFDPLLDLYLNSDVRGSMVAAGNATMVNIFSIISMLILLLACINYSNLSTAAAMKRGKDVGVRKALGASKSQLITQYLMEAFVLTVIAVVISLLIVTFGLSFFNKLMNTTMILAFDVLFIGQMIGLTLVITLMSGSYAAFFLSSLSPAVVLKGLVESSKLAILFRKSLIILQFSIAAFLLVTGLVVNGQMQFIQDMPQGFDRENVLIVSYGDDIYTSLKTQLTRHPDIIATSMSHTVPTKSTRTSNTVRRLDDITTEIWTGNNPIHYNFFETFGIKILAGRDFSQAYVNDAYIENKNDWPSSKGKLIINQTLASTLGWTPNQAIGKILVLGGGNEGLHNHQIIGVVEDTHYVTAKNIIPPMTYVLSEDPSATPLRWISIRLKENTDLKVIEDIKRVWLSLDGNLAFTYSWLSDLFSRSYRNEQQQADLLIVFTFIAILVTAIGLFGLAAFNTQRRIKEIAIRKILGASTTKLCIMLVNQFSSLVILANIIALPVAYILLQDWLNEFIYRIDMPYSAFLITSTFCLVIAYITVFTIAFKAATAKPIDSLSCE